MKRRGILLTNTGTPDSPAVKDLRRYLKSFLGDPRVVRLPRLLWLPILELIVGWRAPHSAKLYEKINTPQGLPLRVIMRDLARNLERHLNVAVGATGGRPDLRQGGGQLHQSGRPPVAPTE